MVTAAEVEARFPSFGWMVGIPEIRDLLQQSQNENWTADLFATKLHETNWWKSTSESARLNDALKVTDPQTYELALQDMTRNVVQIQQQEGIGDSPEHARALATMFYREGWGADQIRDWMVSNAHTFDKGGIVGNIQATAAKIKALSSDYGLPMSDQTASFHAKQIESQGSTIGAITEMLREQAKATYAHLAPQLDAGHTIRDIAEPYVQSAAQLLEISPDAIDLSDPRWSRALSYDPGQTGKPTLMGLGEWQKTVMSDVQYGWDRTNNAKATAYDIRDKLAQTMGVR